jgi:GST-like protein
MYELLAGKGGGSTIIEAALELSGVAYQRTEAAPWEPVGPGLPRLRALNPLAQVPTLVLPDGTVMTESAAMLLHLADHHPEAGLAPPAQDASRPAFLRWLVFLVANIYPTFTVGDEPSRWVSEPGACEELRQRTDAYRERLWTLMEAAAAGPWFLGERRSAVDLYVATMSRWRPRRQWFATHCPKLHAIALRVEGDPRLAPVFAQNFT